MGNNKENYDGAFEHTKTLDLVLMRKQIMDSGSDEQFLAALNEELKRRQKEMIKAVSDER